jgi:hypothetical protein
MSKTTDLPQVSHSPLFTSLLLRISLSEKYVLIVVLSFAADYPSYKGGYAPEPPAYGPAYAPEPPSYRTAYAPEPPAYPALSHRGPYPAEVV